jgi:AraC-like DNA-binding protein
MDDCWGTEINLDERYPLPKQGNRFMLLPNMRGQARSHPLSRDLFPTSAGVYLKVSERRPYTIDPIPDTFIGYCSAGLGELVMENSSIEINPGDLIILRRGEPVFMGPKSGGCWSLYFLLYEGEQEQHYTNYLKTGNGVVNIGAQPRIATEIDTLVGIQPSILRPEVMTEAACRLKWMLAWLGGLIAARNGAKTSDAFLDRTITFMIARLDSQIDLTELAQLHNLSKFQFARHFQERTGQAPISYFIQMKMQRACELLDSTSSDIKAIAECLGYSDPYYFSRLFKNSVGLSPQQYRRTHLT